MIMFSMQLLAHPGFPGIRGEMLPPPPGVPPSQMTPLPWTHWPFQRGEFLLTLLK